MLCLSGFLLWRFGPAIPVLPGSVGAGIVGKGLRAAWFLNLEKQGKMLRNN